MSSYTHLANNIFSYYIYAYNTFLEIWYLSIFLIKQAPKK